MDLLERNLREWNSQLNWIDTIELTERFLGREIFVKDTQGVVEYLNTICLPEKVAYVPSDLTIESVPCSAKFCNEVFGEMPVQGGYCIGHNRHLNALEFHMGSEVIIAASSMVLLLDSCRNIENESYNPKTLLALFVNSGQVIELFGGTLHFAPLEVSADGFRAAIYLMKGTNTPLSASPQGLLFAKNKWLIAHASSPSASRGAKVGILGENVILNISKP